MTVVPDPPSLSLVVMRLRQKVPVAADQRAHLVAATSLAC